MDANTVIGPVRWEEGTLRVVTLIAATTALVFYLDLITPLGLTVWILYFIPLFLTLYVQWDGAPFAATAVFLALIGATSLLSSRDVSFQFALLNRLFFVGMLVVTAVFIWSARQAADRLRVSEEHHRTLAETSPDSILVSTTDQILYANPASKQMFAADPGHDLVGLGIDDLVDPTERESMHLRVRQTMDGARMHIAAVRMIRLDGVSLCADAALGEITWDGVPAVQLLLRPASSARTIRGAGQGR